MSLANIQNRKLALRVLDAARLRELLDLVDLKVADRRARDGLIQALADARRVAFPVVLGHLTRDELKAMCRALGLGDEGKEKAGIIARLIGEDGEALSAVSEVAEQETEPEAEASLVPWRSQVIDLMKRDELIEVIDELGLEVPDRRVVRSLREAVAGSGASLTVVLENLPRTRLKELCRVLGLDDGGKEKAPIIDRLAREDRHDDEADEPQPSELPATEQSLPSVGPEIITALLGGALEVEQAGSYWPLRGTVAVGDQRIAVDIHVRVIGGTGRNELERRFQNPVHGPAIAPTSGRPCLLLGVWIEQGLDRAVVVAFDAYRREGKTTRFSLFMTLGLLEQGADTDFVEHKSASGEVLYAFRPHALARYLDAFAQRKTWGQHDPGTWARPQIFSPTSTSAPLVATTASGTVEIRPRSAMFAAFARLNYKPWYALAELVDNAVQSFLSNRERIIAAGDTGPLVVDISVENEEISITDRAAGISLEDFPRAFSPATPPADASGLSEFGLGMKAAACWFSDEWSVRTSALGDPVERTVHFDVPKITFESMNELPIQAQEVSANLHHTIITMRRLRTRLRGRTLTKVKEHLASIYRLLIADGSLTIRFTANGKEEVLAHEQPKLLRSPYTLNPGSEPVLWRRDLDIPLEDGRRVTGWAGILARGKHEWAGLAVFRRQRLIEGSVGEAYRPRQVFRGHNSFESQRIVGELHVEGFDVTHTKDGIRWGEDEDVIGYALEARLDEEPSLLKQARNFRARTEASMLRPTFGEDALEDAASSLGSVDLSQPSPPASTPTAAEPRAPSVPPPSADTMHSQTFTMKLEGDKGWEVQLELVRDKSAPWLHAAIAGSGDNERMEIRVNLDHPFSEEHLNDNERALGPVLRLAVAMALGERQARDSGVMSAASIRKNANELLRLGLATLPMTGSQGGKHA